MTIMTKQLQVTAEAEENIANINCTFADRNGENPSKGFSKLSKVIRKMLLAAGTADGFNASKTLVKKSSRFKIGCQRSRAIGDQSAAERLLFCVNFHSDSKADRQRTL